MYPRDLAHCSLTSVSDLAKGWAVKTADDEILFDYLNCSYFQCIIKICSKCQFNQLLEPRAWYSVHKSTHSFRKSFYGMLRSNLLNVFFVSFEHLDFKQSVSKPLKKPQIYSKCKNIKQY